MTAVLIGQEPAMGKKRNDRSAKIDALVLFKAEAVVNWRKQTKPEDDKLTVAEYLSRMIEEGVASEYEQATKWMAQQAGRAPVPRKKGDT